MTAFDLLRLWLRRASTAERTTSAVAAVIAVVLFSYLVAPVGSGSVTDTLQSSDGGGAITSGGSNPSTPNQSSSGASGTGASGTGASGTGSTSGSGSTSGTGSSGTASSGTGSTGGTGSSGTGTSGTGSTAGPTRSCPPTVDQGITASEIKIAVTIINIAGAAGGNTAINVPSIKEQQQDWEYVRDSVNASGGAACRKLSLSFYQVNPVDPTDTQIKCQSMADGKPFLALDTGALTGGLGSADCLPQAKVPLISTYLGVDQLKKYYPYYISPGDIVDNVVRNGILGLKQNGYFSAAKGFKKLGVLFYSCQAGPVNAMKKALTEAGIGASQQVVYDMGCPPGGQYSAADYQQAVLAFKNAHADHVTYSGNGGKFADFTAAANQQGYKPQYVAADSALPSAAGTNGASPANLDGAVDGVGGRYAEESTPRYQPSEGTAKCNAIFAAKGRPPVYKQGVGYGGVVCHNLFFVVQLLNHAPRLQRSALVSGMHSIGFYPGSYPFGQINFSGAPAGAAYGAGYWRIVKYFKSCTCWNVLDPTWHPKFP